MQSTGQASTHAVSLVPMHGSAITYVIVDLSLVMAGLRGTPHSSRIGFGAYSGFHAPTNSLFSLGSYSTMYPATALAATVSGLAKYICPGPLRPGQMYLASPL